MSDNGTPPNWQERMERMEAFLQATVAAMQEYFRQSTEQHERTMKELREQREEIGDLITLQREHRIDIMALFQIPEQHRKRLDKLGEE